MKARNNTTGEIVTNFQLSRSGESCSYVKENGTLVIENIVEGKWTAIDDQENDTFDWELFRRNVAKDIMVGLVSNLEYYSTTTRHDTAVTSVKLADELINQLKNS
jgi:hypothetical protein